MPRTYIRKPGSRRYADYTQESLQECLNALKNGELTQRQAELKFNIPRRTIVNKLNKSRPNKPGQPPIFSEEEEIQFVKCLTTFSEYGFPLDTTDFRMIVKSYLSRIGRKVKKFTNNIPGMEWVKSFINRHHELSARFASNIKRSRAGVNESTLHEYITNLGETVKDVPPENIWNFDESNLTDDPGQKKVIVKRGMKYPEKIRNTSKSSISLMFCGNAAGEFLPPYVVYRAANIWSTWTENGPPGSRYNVSQSGWFDSNTFDDWFETILLTKLKKQSGRKVVICDNLSSHFSVKVLQHCQNYDIAFVCLPPNSTHLTQPLDVSFFRPMKAAWRKILQDWKETEWGKNSTCLEKRHFPILLKKLLESIQPNQKKNLMSGFKTCGVVPVDVTPLLEKLPGTMRNTSTKDIDDSFLDSLKTQRSELTQPKFIKKKKLNVVPGKSVGPEIFQNDASVASTSKESSTALIKNQLTKKTKASNKSGMRKFTFAGSRNKTNNSVDDDNKLLVCDLSDPESDLMHEVEEFERDKEAENEIDAITTGEKSYAELLSLEKAKREVGEFVVFSYEGEYFPGKILSLTEDEVVISAMQRSLKSWKWPEKPDVHNYEWEDVIGHISDPKVVSKRGFFEIPELNKLWWF